MPFSEPVNRWLTLAVGALIGQWLAFAGGESPASAYSSAMIAWQHNDYAEAARLWSRAAALQPDNPRVHYMLAGALAKLGHRASAAEAYRLTLLLDPPETLARMAQDALARLAAEPLPRPSAGTSVRLEFVNGVWIVPVTINGTRSARFLLDTGASVTLLAPSVAGTLGIQAPRGASTLELHTVAGVTAGLTVSLDSIRVGEIEVTQAPAVIHDPGPGVDGILGNTFLGRYRVTIDADRKTLDLTPFGKS